jgi:hypothetical protein
LYISESSWYLIPAHPRRIQRLQLHAAKQLIVPERRALPLDHANLEACFIRRSALRRKSAAGFRHN